MAALAVSGDVGDDSGDDRAANSPSPEPCILDALPFLPARRADPERVEFEALARLSRIRLTLFHRALTAIRGLALVSESLRVGASLERFVSPRFMSGVGRSRVGCAL